MNKNKYYILSFYLLAAFIFIFGAGERILFIRNFVAHPTLSFNMPQTDQFNYHVMAEDQLQNYSPALKMTVYPVYLEFVKSVYYLFGVQISYIFYIQLLLSMISVLMIYGLGRWLFNPISGFCAAFLLLFYKMNFQSDAELLPSSLSQFLIIASLFFYMSFHKKNTLLNFMFMLISFLFLGLFRPFMWLIFLPALAYKIFRRKLWKSPVYIFILILWTLLVSFLFQRFHTPESFLHKFGMMFYMTNLEKSSGLLISLPGIPLTAEGHVKNSLFVACKGSQKIDNLNTFWINEALSEISKHPFSFIKLTFKKIFLLSNQFEIHNNTSIYFHEKYTLLGKFFSIPFPILFAGGVFGIALCLHQRKKMALIFILSFVILMIMTMPICSRYRLPMIPFLALFSGYSFSLFLEKISSGHYFDILKFLILFFLLFLFSILPAKELNKENDIRYWESIEDRKAKYMDTLKICHENLSQKKNLPLEQRVNALIQLGRLHDYRVFFNEYPVIIKQSLSNIFKMRLQKQYAFMLETIFQFMLAKKEWENLSSFPELKNLASRKIDELSVYEKYLETGE